MEAALRPRGWGPETDDSQESRWGKVGRSHLLVLNTLIVWLQVAIGGKTGAG